MQDKTAVLFCGPINHPLNSGRYMMAGLEQLGFRVIGYDYRTPERSDHEEPLLDIVKREKPRFVFTLRGEKLTAELIGKLKQMGCITILWFTMIQLEEWMPHFARAHDFVFTNFEDHVEYFKAAGAENVAWMHQGFAPEFFGIDAAPLPPPKHYYADVAMIGSMGGSPKGHRYDQRCRMVMSLRQQGIDIKWWGPRLGRKLRNLPYFLGGVNRAWGGREVYMKDFADVIRHTKIFLGQDEDTFCPRRYLSNRSFAALGCGGFYLCRRTPGVEFAYEVGKEVVVFDTNEEMLDKIRFYLAHERERHQIAQAGQQRVLGCYTYKHQMEKIFNIVHQYL